jgi:hypothetical protein
VFIGHVQCPATSSLFYVQIVVQIFRNNSTAVNENEHLTALLIPQLDIPIIPDAAAAAAAAPSSQDAPSSDPDLAISSKTQDGQDMEMSAGMEAKVQLKGLKDEEEKKDEDEEVERIQQRGPAKQVEEKQQRNGQQQQNRPRSGKKRGKIRLLTFQAMRLQTFYKQSTDDLGGLQLSRIHSLLLTLLSPSSFHFPRKLYSICIARNPN